MNLEGIIKGLSEPTPYDELRFMPQGLDKEEKTALALPYYDARFVQQRLDDVCTPFGWQNAIIEVRGFVCVGVGILNPDNQEWLWKWDTGQEEQAEATDAADDDDGIGGAKAIVSRGLKRAAVQWGIGRDVYGMRKHRRACNTRVGKGGKIVFAGWVRNVGAAAEAEAGRERGGRPYIANEPAFGPEPAPLPVASASPPAASAATTPADRKRDSADFAALAQEHKDRFDREAIAAIITRNQGDDSRTDWAAALADLRREVDKPK